MPIYPMPRLIKQTCTAIALTIALSGSLKADDVTDINQLMRKGDNNAALAHANQALAKNPKDAQVRFLKGLILADLNKTSEAIQVFTSITDDYPELPEPYNNLAVLYASQAKYDAAKNALEMAIRTHPSYATAHENLGDLYAKMASMAYDKALQIDSSNQGAQTKLSLIKEIVSGKPRQTGTKTVKQPETAIPVTTTAPLPKTAAQSAPAPKTPSPSGKPDAIETAKAWAKAWSDQDVDAYFSYYSPDFTPAGMSYSEWQVQRRERVGNPDRISITLKDIQVQPISDERVKVQFKQEYQSSRLKNTSSKTLDMELVNGKWRILRESGR